MNRPIPRPMDEKAKASLKSRIIVAFILIAIVAPSIVFGGWVLFFVILAFLLIAVHEMVKAPGKKYKWWVYALCYLFVLVFFCWYMFKNNIREYMLLPEGDFSFSLERYYSTINVSIFAVAAMIGLFFLGAIVDKDFGFHDLAYMVTMCLLIGIGFQSILFVRYFPFYQFTFDPSYSGNIFILGTPGADLPGTSVFDWGTSACLFFYVAAGVVFNDTFAYFFGSAFGKHPLNKRVSPKKSWEGFFAGWILSFVLTFAFGIGLAAGGYPMLPTLDLGHWYWILLLSFALPGFANLGDLSFSLIKRQFNVKDYGTILRGHGGVLDRADSIVFAFAGTALFLVLISGNWNVFLMA